MRSEPFHGQVTVGTGVVQVTSIDEKLERGLLIQAIDTNSGTIYVGFNGDISTSNSYPLTPGAELILPVIDPQKIYVIASTTGNDLRFIGM